MLGFFPDICGEWMIRMKFNGNKTIADEIVSSKRGKTQLTKTEENKKVVPCAKLAKLENI